MNTYNIDNFFIVISIHQLTRIEFTQNIIRIILKFLLRFEINDIFIV